MKKINIVRLALITAMIWFIAAFFSLGYGRCEDKDENQQKNDREYTFEGDIDPIYVAMEWPKDDARDVQLDSFSFIFTHVNPDKKAKVKEVEIYATYNPFFNAWMLTNFRYCIGEMEWDLKWNEEKQGYFRDRGESGDLPQIKKE